MSTFVIFDSSLLHGYNTVHSVWIVRSEQPQPLYCNSISISWLARTSFQYACA